MLVVNKILKTIDTERMFLLGIWVVLTVLNVTKAFHIDDTYHLESAQWISDHWQKPLSGTINWGDNSEPMHDSNNPALFFYGIALVASVFSYSEVPLHLFMSVFTFLTLVFFLRIKRLLYPTSSPLILLIFGFCPALIVNQNLMTDVPLLSFFLGFLYFFLLAGEKKQYRNYLVASIFLGSALLIKFTVLPVFVFMLLGMLVRKHYRYLFMLFIPVLFLGFWSSWNYFEFEGIQILSRSTKDLTLRIFGKNILAFCGCLSAVLPLTIVLIGGIKHWINKVLFVGLIITAIAVPTLLLTDVITHYRANSTMNFLFTFSGIFIVIHFIWTIWKDHRGSNFIQFYRSDKGLLTLVFLGITMFILMFAPFMASRHLLLVIPIILLLYTPYIDKLSSLYRIVFFGTTLLLGVALSISDWNYAQYYKQKAKEIKTLHLDNKTWAVGHWGWQWYATKNGMRVYERDADLVKIGEYLVVPNKVSRQDIHPSLSLLPIDTLYSEPDYTTFFSVNNEASMYSSRFKKPAWSYSKLPLDSIYIFQVDSILEVFEE
tara:strand:- start:11632 stop:13263 length:1632 start_codon:yes stop_codon:yes gene_type:complete